MNEIASVQPPTLVIVGSKGPEVLHHSAYSLVAQLPDGHIRFLDCQDHTIVPEVSGPVVEAFFQKESR